MSSTRPRGRSQRTARASSPPTRAPGRSPSASRRSASSRRRRRAAPTATCSSPRPAPRSSSAASSSSTRRSGSARLTGRRSRSSSPRAGSFRGSRSTGARSRSRSQPGETVTEGLDGLRERFEEYYSLGARFAKWRATYSIGGGRPSDYCVWVNAHALARYAALAQEAGLVPIVEPEVLMDGDAFDRREREGDRTGAAGALHRAPRPTGRSLRARC